MFNIFKTNKDKQSLKTKVSWSISKMTQNGHDYLLRFNKGLGDTVGSPDYSYQVGIATPLNTNNNGFPSGEENKQLGLMEEKIAQDLEKDNICVFAGSIVGGGIKELVFYTSTPKKAESLFSKFASEFKTHKLQLNIQEDKQWEIYKTYCP